MNGAERMDYIIVCNARVNNLKNISVRIPFDSFTCVTGPSGCGKSSLVYDTIYAESQRNLLESMSGNMYGQKLMDKPDVDKIINLRPALNISQNYYNMNPRSTIGTITDISYYARTIYSLYSMEFNSINVDVSYFSPNNPVNHCKYCKGIGEEYVILESLVTPNLEETLINGGIVYYKGSRDSYEFKLLEALCEEFRIDINRKISDLSNAEKEALLYRNTSVELYLKYKTPKGRQKKRTVHSKGAIVELNELLSQVDVPSVYSSISKYLGKVECSHCRGAKLSENVLEISICDKNIADVESIPFTDLLGWLNDIDLISNEWKCKLQIKQLTDEIRKRVSYLVDLKLAYLNLARTIPSLSNGEVQRVRLANQLSCSLTGILYILDEPCKGLHFMDIKAIINATNDLVRKGNTVISIEHNKQYINASNQIIELGPVGGPDGGFVINNEKLDKIVKYDITWKNITKKYETVSIKGISYHNLKKLDVEFPIGLITCVTGVSGAGKSSITKVIAECCDKKIHFNCDEVINSSKIHKVLYVNQTPIGKTPRSTVISYLGIYDKIREIFANEALINSISLQSSDFSMNVKGGRCEYCQGAGKRKIELTYLPESYIECSECGGKRFNNEVRNIRFKGLNINDVLDSSIDKIRDVFIDYKPIIEMLDCMIDIGLGYLTLGQMSMNLSGGEAQRIKLAKSIGVKSNGKNLYILDEPTSGLNDTDITKLQNMLMKLSNRGDTIVIIEHDIEFIARIADYLIDLGSTPGDGGGITLIQGNPKDVVFDSRSSLYNYTDYCCSDL